MHSTPLGYQAPAGSEGQRPWRRKVFPGRFRDRLACILDAGKDKRLVFRLRSKLPVPMSHPRCWQGAPTTHTGMYAEEEQRGQRRGGPAKQVTYFWDGTLI
jgi:hypothetical protein